MAIISTPHPPPPPHPPWFTLLPRRRWGWLGGSCGSKRWEAACVLRTGADEMNPCSVPSSGGSKKHPPHPHSGSVLSTRWTWPLQPIRPAFLSIQFNSFVPVSTAMKSERCNRPLHVRHSSTTYFTISLLVDVHLPNHVKDLLRLRNRTLSLTLTILTNPPAAAFDLFRLF